MAETTEIAWTDHTWSPWIGCQKVSPGCDHCYAETMNARFRCGNWGPGAPRRRTTADYWRQPLAWNRKALAAGLRARVFPSLCDPFDNAVDHYWRWDLWTLIKDTPALDWLLLTKRPQNILKMLPPNWGAGWPNVWLGTSAEDRDHCRQRWGYVAAVPAKVRFLSYEPALGPIGNLDLGRVGAPNWVIVGGESGPGARPMHPDWARGVRDQCAAADVPFFFKQWGEHDETGARVGKKAAGHLLNGVEHHDWPRAVADG
jgi:protein gp37